MTNQWRCVLFRQRGLLDVLLTDERLSVAELTLSSGLITREHLARDLPRAPCDDRLDGLIADILAGNVIDGLEPPPVVLDFQTHLGAPIFRYPAYAFARLARVRF